MYKKSFLILIVIFFVSMISINFTPKIDYNLDEQVKNNITKKTLESKILEIKNSNNIDEIKVYYELADFLNIKIDTIYEEKNVSSWNFIENKTHNFYNGFIKGETNNYEQFYLSVASDFLLIGDIRDFSNEGKKYINNESYDEIVLILSGAGIILTGSQVVTVGASTPLKMGVTILKIFRKTGDMSKDFSKFMYSKLAKTVNKNKLMKEINISSNNSDLIKSFNNIRDSFDFSHLKSLSDSITTIKKNTSLYDTTKLLSFVDNEKDLIKLKNFSSKYKQYSLPIMKLLGKNALKATKYAYLFFLQLYAMIGSFFSILLMMIIRKIIWKRYF